MIWSHYKTTTVLLTIDWTVVIMLLLLVKFADYSKMFVSFLAWQHEPAGKISRVEVLTTINGVVNVTMDKTLPYAEYRE